MEFYVPLTRPCFFLDAFVGGRVLVLGFGRVWGWVGVVPGPPALPDACKAFAMPFGMPQCARTGVLFSI